MMLRIRTPAGECTGEFTGSTLVSTVIEHAVSKMGLSRADKLELYGPLGPLSNHATLLEARVHNCDVVIVVATGTGV